MKIFPLVVASLVSACAPASDSNAEAVEAPVAASAATSASTNGPRLAFPVACEIGKTCEVQNFVDHDPGPGAKDYRCGTQTYQDHGGIDIRLHDMAAQAAGVNVLAAAPGRVVRLRDGVADISVKSNGAASVAGQECGNGVVVDHGDGWETQYCHLAQGSVVVKQGDPVATGQPLARIGLSGNTEYPHLHLTVRKAGVMVDPFAPDLRTGACSAGPAGDGMWTHETAKAMAYKPGSVLNAGFAAAPMTMDAIEVGRIVAPVANSAMLIAYVRAINLQGGDVQKLIIRAPDGTVLAQAQQPALDRAKAQYMIFTGKLAPEGGWKPGIYAATYVVERDGRTTIAKDLSIAIHVTTNASGGD